MTAATPDGEQAPLRIGMLGAGMIATVGYGILPNLKWITDKVEVVAIADPVVERAQEAAKEFNIPEVYDGVDSLLENAELDAVVNVTPIAYHGETSLKIVRAGKHLATEKPLATTMDDANAIIAQLHLLFIRFPSELFLMKQDKAQRERGAPRHATRSRAQPFSHRLFPSGISCEAGPLPLCPGQ